MDPRVRVHFNINDPDICFEDSVTIFERNEDVVNLEVRNAPARGDDEILNRRGVIYLDQHLVAMTFGLNKNFHEETCAFLLGTSDAMPAGVPADSEEVQ